MEEITHLGELKPLYFYERTLSLITEKNFEAKLGCQAKW